MDWQSLVRGGWDLIVSNPPYIRTPVIGGLEPEVRAWDPAAALDGGEDGLDAYRALAPMIAESLRPGNLAMLEIGYDQSDSAAGILESAGLSILSRRKDLSGLPRLLVIGLA